jgi:hypothetical protein
MTGRGVSREYNCDLSYDVITRGYFVNIIVVFAGGTEEDSEHSGSSWPVWSSKMNPVSSLSAHKTRCLFI